MAMDINLAFSERVEDLSPLGQFRYRAIAAIALLVHLTCLWLLGDVGNSGFAFAQSVAALSAAVTVYAINATQTHWQRGPWRWYLGLLPFLASCWFGIGGCVLLAMALADKGLDGLAAGSAGALFALWWNQGAVSRHGWTGR